MNHFPSVNGRVATTPRLAGWQYLHFAVETLEPGRVYAWDSGDLELAIVPLSGTGMVEVGDQTFSLSRASVWLALPQVLYLRQSDLHMWSCLRRIKVLTVRAAQS